MALASSAIFTAQGALVYTTFDMPSGSVNVRSFTINEYGITALSTLTNPGPNSFTYAYAYRFFTPSVTGTCSLGMTDADYDPVMILYSGKTSFPVASPGDGAIALNDDGIGISATGSTPLARKRSIPRPAQTILG